MLPEHIRVHTAASDQAQASGITYCRSQPPSAVPDHASLNNGIMNPEQPGDSVGKDHSALKVHPVDSLFFLILAKKVYLWASFKFKA
jgi:hypothetical protein